MKNYLFFCSLFCILTFQPAYAQRYEYTGQAPTYININGEEYVRIPHQKEKKPTNYHFTTTYPQKSSSKHYTLSTSTKLKPYIGLDVGYNKLDKTTLDDEYITEFTHITYTQLPKKNISLSGILGLQLNPKFSLEAFYLDTIANNKRNGTTSIVNSSANITHTLKSSTEISFKSYGLDTIYSHPIYNQTFQILASLGLGLYDIKAKYKIDKSIILSSKNQSIGYRFGIGAQYNFNKHLSLRTMLRYVKLTDDKIIDDMIEFSTGLRYYF